MFSKVAGVVVLYNPEITVLENIRTYSSFVEKLIIVDNSEKPSTSIVSSLENSFTHVKYVALNRNVGIAKALNIGATQAHDEGFDWLLMMDQDSSSSHRMVEQLLTSAQAFGENNIGIVAPQYLTHADTHQHKKVEEVYSVITSGSLLNLSAYEKTGPFRDDLFIDFVDHEYCLRLRQSGFRIIVNNEVKLYHQLGNISCHNFLGRRLCTSNHNYLRRYYITRNRLEILREFKDQFPEFLVTEKNKNFVEIIKVLLFEKDKFRKLRSFIYGYIDYKRKRFGSYTYK